MSPIDLAIWGTSGHARVATTIARLDPRWRIVGYLDSVYPERHGSDFCGAPVLGGHEALDALRSRGVRHVFLAFGANQARMQLADELRAGGFELPSLVHPSAIVADDVRLDEGVFVGPAVVVNADASVGAQSILNSASIIEHDVRIGRAVHVSPRACLAGAVVVGDCAWIGAGAVVRDKLRIGDRAIVGMGGVVIRSVEADTVVVGCPARALRKASV
jgi:sugar O-acyltransferase (sialic acid O-acetyltransferase NeuD family)